MRRTSILATATLGIGLLAAGIPQASAQSGGDGSGNYGAVGSWYAQNRLAERMMAESDWRDTQGLLSEADTALGRGNTMLANELLERAETRLLSRSIDATLIERPAVGGVAGTISEARQAVVRGNRAEARDRIRQAMQAMDRNASMTGAGDVGAMQGGGSTVVVPSTSGQTTVIYR